MQEAMTNRIQSFDDAVIRPPILVDSPHTEVHAAPTRAFPTIVLLAALVLLGCGLRIAVFAQNNSLWIDEAMLALNVLNRSPVQLLEPLDLNQGAPIGYLLMCKGITSVFGGAEWVLRLPSLIAGLGATIVFARAAMLLLPKGAALLATTLFSLAPYLIGYCGEFKQYELDSSIAVGLFALALPIPREGWSGGRAILIALAGAIAVWFSHPAAFVLAGIGSAVLLESILSRDRAVFLSRLCVVAAWGLSFVVCYLLFTRKLGLNPYLLQYWSGQFMPLPPTRPGDFAWIVHQFFEFFDKPGGLNAMEVSSGGLAGLCFLIGCAAFARTDWKITVALALPLFAAMLASGFHKYPFAGRLLLFEVPAALILIAHGAAILSDRVGQTLPGARSLVLTVLLLAPIAQTYELFKKPLHDEKTREALEYIRGEMREGDRLYVFYGGVPAFAYYQSRFEFPVDAVKFGVENRNGSQRKFFEELQEFKGCPRVWVIAAHRQGSEWSAIRAYLDGMGRELEIRHWPDADVVLYDLGG